MSHEEKHLHEEEHECCCHDHHDGCCHEEEHEHHHSHGCACCHHEEEEEERSKKDIILLGVRCGAALLLALLGRLYVNEAMSIWGNHLLMVAAWLIVSYDIVYHAAKNLFVHHEFFDENVLMLFASLGAFCLRFFGQNEFFEAVLVLLLYQVGEMFEDLAADKSQEAITSAIDLRDEEASVEIDGEIVRKHAEELEVGDLVVLGAGMKILCDGVVAEGEGTADESSVTGEFLPVSKSIGSEVVSGTILKTGSIKARVGKAYSDSTVAKLLDLVTNSAEKKSKSTRFITKFAKVYTPIVMASALLVALLPPLFLGIGDGSVWARWIYAALSFLVVSCPCAIVISVPLAYFAGLGLASKNGIVVKGAEYYDKLNELSMVCFDKTGTLTKGVFQVSEIHPVGLPKETFLEYAAAAESRSSHPIGKAICKAYEGTLSTDVSSYEEISGFGVKTVYRGHTILTGKAELLEADGIRVGTPSANGSITYLSVDGSYAGYLVLNDVIRPSSKPMIASLHSMGIRTVMLTGDKEKNADSVGEEIGIDEVNAELLPAEKTEILQQKIDASKGMVAYVGDGINDAPSIVLADVGIAMGGLGSDATVANADVVLMNDDPEKVVQLLRVAKKTKGHATAAIAISLAVKLGIMGASVAAAIMGTWELPLWIAVLGDSGLALLMVLLSLSLLWAKPKK